VVDLNPANFDRLVIQSDNVWIVEFYAPWCGHCQQFVPEYSKAATSLKVKCGVYQEVKYVLNGLHVEAYPLPLLDTCGFYTHTFPAVFSCFVFVALIRENAVSWTVVGPSQYIVYYN